MTTATMTSDFAPRCNRMTGAMRARPARRNPATGLRMLGWPLRAVHGGEVWSTHDGREVFIAEADIMAARRGDRVVVHAQPA